MKAVSSTVTRGLVSGSLEEVSSSSDTSVCGCVCVSVCGWLGVWVLTAGQTPVSPATLGHHGQHVLWHSVVNSLVHLAGWVGAWVVAELHPEVLVGHAQELIAEHRQKTVGGQNP